MRTRVRKWGNSLAVRVPKSFAMEAGLGPGTSVELSLDNGKLLVTPVVEPPPTLDDLLAGVTDKNLHREVESGPPAGNEVW